MSLVAPGDPLPDWNVAVFPDDVAPGPQATSVTSTKRSAPATAGARNRGFMADRVAGRPEVGRALELARSREGRRSGSVEGA